MKLKCTVCKGTCTPRFKVGKEYRVWDIKLVGTERTFQIVE